MINPILVMKVLNERHQFIKNHPELIPFIQEHFKTGLESGSCIDLCIKNPEKQERSLKIEIQDSDIPLLAAISEMLQSIE